MSATTATPVVITNVLEQAFEVERAHQRLFGEDSENGRAYRALSEALDRLESPCVQRVVGAAREEIDRSSVRIRFAMAQLRELVIKLERSAD